MCKTSVRVGGQIVCSCSLTDGLGTSSLSRRYQTMFFILFDMNATVSFVGLLINNFTYGAGNHTDILGTSFSIIYIYIYTIFIQNL